LTPLAPRASNLVTIHPVPDRSKVLRLRKNPLLSAISIAALLLVWEVASRLHLVPPLFLPAPSRVAWRAWELTANGELPIHLAASLKRILVGYVLGAGVGVAVGIGTGFFGGARAVGQPLIHALYPIPKIAILPLLILWLGIGEPPKIFVIAIGAFFPVAINTHAGIAECDPALLRAGISFGANRWDLVRHVLLPAALPVIFAGLRLSAGLSLLLVVSAELISADSGIGFLILNAADLLHTEDLMVGLATLSLLGVLFNTGLGFLERHVIRWK
jgi:NitT/TauT family transport system permease protein